VLLHLGQDRARDPELLINGHPAKLHAGLNARTIAGHRPVGLQQLLRLGRAAVRSETEKKRSSCCRTTTAASSMSEQAIIDEIMQIEIDVWKLLEEKCIETKFKRFKSGRF
jgi:hypothetical protein